ncbi:hypothetical protein CHARACLAT_021531, partial [Characodon lateralis]|nr:hypothetical protein [Characodon lateralis]
MEGSEGEENESSSVWKQFQAKAKPLLSPKLGGRELEEQSKRSMWMFKKTKRKENVALDRIISSSQPDLLFSSKVDVKPQEVPLCGKATGSGSLLGREKLHSSIKRKSIGASKPTVAQLVQSHHKSSSLGSACLERLTEPPSGGDAATAEAAAVETVLERKHEQA